MIGDINDNPVRRLPFFFEESGRRRYVIPIINEFSAGLPKLLSRLLEILGPKSEMTDPERSGTAVLLCQLGAAVTQYGHVERAVAQIYSLGKRRIGATFLNHIEGLLVKSRGRFRIGGVQRQM